MKRAFRLKKELRPSRTPASFSWPWSKNATAPPSPPHGFPQVRAHARCSSPAAIEGCGGGGGDGCSSCPEAVDLSSRASSSLCSGWFSTNRGQHSGGGEHSDLGTSAAGSIVHVSARPSPFVMHSIGDEDPDEPNSESVVSPSRRSSVYFEGEAGGACRQHHQRNPSIGRLIESLSGLIPFSDSPPRNSTLPGAVTSPGGEVTRPIAARSSDHADLSFSQMSDLKSASPSGMQVGGASHSASSKQRYIGGRSSSITCPIGPRLASSRGMKLLLRTGSLTPLEAQQVSSQAKVSSAAASSGLEVAAESGTTAVATEVVSGTNFGVAIACGTEGGTRRAGQHEGRSVLDQGPSSDACKQFPSCPTHKGMKAMDNHDSLASIKYRGHGKDPAGLAAGSRWCPPLPSPGQPRTGISDPTNDDVAAAVVRTKSRAVRWSDSAATATAEGRRVGFSDALPKLGGASGL